MKTARFYLLILLLSFLTLPSLASHIVGLRITYEYNGSAYLFKLKMYRDCSGINAPSTVMLCFTSQSGCATSFNTTLLMDAPNSGFEVPFNSCAAVGATTCQGGSIFAFEEYNYIGVVSVPPCSDWIVSYSLCCRNAAITNLVNPDFYSAYVETRFDNLNFPGNSSPQFNAVPVNYYCAGVQAFVDYSAFDIDGDSLSYEFTDIHDGNCGGPGVAIPYAGPYTYNQPLATLSPTTFDPYTGQIEFTPSSTQISVIGFKVNEYRNGVLIGSVRRDDEIVVVGNFINPDSIAGTAYYDMNTNAVFDAGDFPASGVMVHMGPGNSYQSTFSNGKYLFQTIPGTFTVQLPNPPLYTTPVPSNYVLSPSTGGQFLGGNDFALQPTPNINDLEVYLNNAVPPVPGMSCPLYINYQNSGTTTQTNVDIQLTLDNKLSFQSAIPVPSNINGNIITWNFSSIGIFTGGIISVITETDTTATQGDTVNCSVTISSGAVDNTTLNNIDFLAEPVLNSYDPNNKEVNPEGDLPVSYSVNEGYLNYTINFQNLGTAPANLIRIHDLIDADLNLGSIEMVASSKPCVMNFAPPNRLEFNFYNANLPPAILNEPYSHGFVEFKIRLNPDLQPGMLISNNARIYFDFNAPIFTNNVYNPIVVPTGVQQINDPGFSVSIYPNPTSDLVNIELICSESEPVMVQLFNVLGMKVNQQEYKTLKGFNSFTVPMNNLDQGMYFIRFNYQGKSFDAKLVRN